MFIYKIPNIVKRALPKLIWEIPLSIHQNKFIYFTFDDGPTPEITNFVLEELNKFQATASFFCIGKNIKQNPELINQILESNCTIGNHTMNHLNAWKTSSDIYRANRALCDQEINNFNCKSVGFRPPYGRITSNIYNSFSEEPIYMWSVLTGDYRKESKSEEIISNCLPLLKPGSIVVFHDSVKSFHHLKIILPVFLAYCKENNLKPCAL
ncbi:MAG: Chitooligosaccharide deacetylase [Bacteroidota bacterium]|jgi:peptidoglycan/xylan/chitin deacetylase (PgdA/CDA1 family)